MRNPRVLGATDPRILETVALDDSGAVAQKRELPFVLFQPPRRLRGIVLRDREQDGPSGFDLGKRFLQLTELLLAEWSPVAAAKELQDDRVLPPKIRELVDFPFRIGQLEIWSLVSHVHGHLGDGDSRAGYDDREKDRCDPFGQLPRHQQPL